MQHRVPYNPSADFMLLQTKSELFNEKPEVIESMNRHRHAPGAHHTMSMAYLTASNSFSSPTQDSDAYRPP